MENVARQIWQLIKASENRYIVKFYYFILYRRNSLIFIPIRDEVDKTHEWIKQLPKDFDIVVAIGRAGLLEGCIIATTLGKPLTTPELFAIGKIYQPLNVKERVFHKALLVDDGLSTGKHMKEAEQIVREKEPNIAILKAVLIVNENAKKLVDFYYETTLHGTAFEHDIIDGKTNLVVDLDGVLYDETHEKAYLVPSFEIKAIVTGRLNSRRVETEAWLEKSGVKYKRLFMWDGKNSIVDFKVRVVRQVKPYWFWESEPTQAIQIHKRSGVRVICIKTMKEVS